MSPILSGMEISGTGSDLEAAVSGADIIVTATSAQAPLLQAAWMKPGATPHAIPAVRSRR